MNAQRTCLTVLEIYHLSLQLPCPPVEYWNPLFPPFPPIKALRPLMIQLIIPCFSCGMAYVPTVVQSHSDKHSLAIFYLRALSGSQNWRAWPWPVSMVTYLFIMLSIFLIFGLSLTSHENLNSNFRNRYGVFFQESVLFKYCRINNYSQTRSSVPPKNPLMNLLFESWIRC